jgi:hypothetical protein
MKTGDVLNVSRDTKLSATGTFSLLLGNLSAFYGTRVDTRKFILMKIIPSTRQLLPSLTPLSDHAPLDRSQVLPTMTRRLRQTNDLVRSYGGHLIFLIPASTDLTAEEYLREAAQSLGIETLVPLGESDVSPKDFGDGFHLTQAGARRYTASLVPQLEAVLRGLN